MGSQDEEDDDSHYCIKCHRTIHGLDNYVAHRKAKCRSEGQVRAVDFFTSLNLQSSSKTSNAWPPSPAYTGGKWTPGATEQNEPQQAPPPGHTGGKWKPTQTDSSQSNQPPVAPPPDHTRGKWGPAERPWGQLRKGLYWCGPCNRRLSSRVVYERHVRSELHFKRTSHWPRVETEIGKRSRVRTKAILTSTLKVVNRRYTKEKEMVRKKKGGPLVCEACRCKVWPHLIGKHLVSYYHYRYRRPGWEHLVLQNMDSIVQHYPFQCGLCRFYTNTVKEFMDHWSSDMHLENDLKLEGCYWCNVCKRSCDSTLTMGRHLNSEPHREIVSVLNRSVPVVIQKHISLKCEICSRGFRSNFKLRAHARLWGHVQTKSTASDRYQEVTVCKDCDYRCFSLASYQRHIRLKHGKEMHFCRKCDQRFDTVDEAKRHRQEAKHRDKGNLARKCCTNCRAEFIGLAALRDHLAREHPEERHRCPKCGAEFILKQELSQHARGGECLGRADESGGGSRTCEQCAFSTGSEAELLLHRSLAHGEPEGGRYPCKSCGRLFSKETLKNHVRTHTKERPFPCKFCNLSFGRRDALNKHISRLHDRTLLNASSQVNSAGRQNIAVKSERSKDFSCPECSAAFYDRGSLAKHQQRHDGKRFPCQTEGCIFKGRSAAELRAHERTHNSSREFHCSGCPYSAKTRSQLAKHIKSLHCEGRKLECPHCDFSTKNSTHLRRHVGLHSGQKPYRCPHCTFSCSLLENLRKHVISSKLHPGKCLYQCGQCQMKTNYSKEMRAHLVSVHGADPARAERHVEQLYRPEGGSSSLVPVKPNKRKRKSAADVEEDQMPTLASVALTPQEEDVIFIEVDEGLEGVLYQTAEPPFHLEAYVPDRT